MNPEESKTLPPEMVIKRDMIDPHKTDIERILMDKLPGYIPDISGAGQIPGCRMAEFVDYSWKDFGLTDEMAMYIKTKQPNWSHMKAVEKVNMFFQMFANYMLRNHHIKSDSVVIFYTSMLDEQDTADLQEVSDAIRREINKKRAERKTEQELKEAEEKLRVETIMSVGKKAIDHNLFGKLDALEKKNEELLKEIKNLKREKGKK